MQQLVSRLGADGGVEGAAGKLRRQSRFIGEDPRSEVIQRGLKLLRDKPPVWNLSDGSIDMLYWYKGMLAAFQAGGETWNLWRKALGYASGNLPDSCPDTIAWTIASS